MEHMKMHSLNKIDENISKIASLFPNCVTEAKDENGEITHKIDFDMLKQELSNTLVEGREERYQFTWPDKKQAILTANAPINKTLRPCREESVNFDTTENLYNVVSTSNVKYGHVSNYKELKDFIGVKE